MTLGRATLATGAHPHSRGENAPGRLKKNAPRGSSPLTRGKPDDVGEDLTVQGLIPTHAGKT